jgi:hypothetical protein
VLGIPEDVITWAMIPMGYPTGRGAEARRRPVAEGPYWDTGSQGVLGVGIATHLDPVPSAGRRDQRGGDGDLRPPRSARRLRHGREHSGRGGVRLRRVLGNPQTRSTSVMRWCWSWRSAPRPDPGRGTERAI